MKPPWTRSQKLYKYNALLSSKYVDAFLASLGIAEYNNLVGFEFKTEKKFLELAARTGKLQKIWLKMAEKKT